jgi:hypothetical protein
MSFKQKIDLPSIATGLVSLAHIAFSYTRAPAKIPFHWNLDGSPGLFLPKPAILFYPIMQFTYGYFSGKSNDRASKLLMISSEWAGRFSRFTVTSHNVFNDDLESHSSFVN